MDGKEMRRRLKAGEVPLEVSIQKWQDIVDGKGKDSGEQNCALCHTYPDANCKGCPIAIKTGLMACEGTPYEKYVSLDENNPALDFWAQKELEFLKSLRNP